MFGKKLNTVLLTSDVGWAHAAVEKLSQTGSFQVVAVSQSERDCLEHSRDFQAEVVLVDQTSCGGRGLEAAGSLARQLRAALVFLASDQPTLDVWRKAVSLGIRNTMSKAFAPDEVLKMVSAALEEEKRKIQESGLLALEQSAPRVHVSSGVPVPRQQVIAVYSPKGGVGKTMLAVSLAAAMRKDASRLVVDLDCGGGGGSIEYFCPNPQATLADWRHLSSNGQIDRQAVESLLSPHKSGLWMLPAPTNLGEQLEVKDEVVERVLDIVSGMFHYVVLDLGQSLRHDATLVGLSRATAVVVVIGPELFSMHRLAAFKRNIESYSWLLEPFKVRLVLNSHVPVEPKLNLAEVSKLAFPVAKKIPYDDRAGACFREGGIPTVDLPHSAYSEAVFSLAEGLAPGSGERASRRGGGLFSLFRKKRRVVTNGPS